MAKKKRSGKKKTDTTFAIFNFITLVLIAICGIMVLVANLPNCVG